MRSILHCEVHPDNPQGRRLQVVADRLRAGDIVALPTAAGYLLACRLDDKAAAARLLRGVDERQPVMLLCRDVAQAAAYLRIDDRAFRAIRETRRGAAAFLLRCTHRVPRRLASGAGGAGLLYFGGHAACEGLMELLDEPLLVLPPEDGVQEPEALCIDRRGSVDVVLDAGPLAELEAVACVELFGPSRSGPMPWARRAAAGDALLAA